MLFFMWFLLIETENIATHEQKNNEQEDKHIKTEQSKLFINYCVFYMFAFVIDLFFFIYFFCVCVCASSQKLKSTRTRTWTT